MSNPTTRQLISYYRVSTKDQGMNGLGMEAQQTAVSGVEGTVIDSFKEVASGKSNTRPQMLAAIEACKKTGATLVVAKLDRLARSVGIINDLMMGDVDFIIADMPGADRFTIHIIAALAQREAELISARTKAALAEKKKQGVKLGAAAHKSKGFFGHNLGKTFPKKKLDYPAPLLNQMRRLREGGSTYQAIADEINILGWQTTTGSEFSSTTVIRILKRLEEERAEEELCCENA